MPDYSYSWGSGVKGTGILAFSKGKVVGPAWRSNYEKGFTIKELNDNTVEVLSETTQIGEIQFMKNKDCQSLEVKLNDNVTKEIIDSILLPQYIKGDDIDASSVAS